MSDAAPCAHGERIPIDGGGLLLFADAFRSDSAQLMDALLVDVRWTRHRLQLFGKRIDAPRLSAWHAEPGCNYRYSGLDLEPEPLDRHCVPCVSASKRWRTTCSTACC
ncbi:MAG: hypothetical protein IPH83_15195 [Gammaproteobacteria bacterium]|nr:hypothetical protein [Gammaproteobacteria bacterium]